MEIRRYWVMPLLCLIAVLIAPAIVLAQPLHLPIETPEQDRAFSEFNHHLTGFFLLAIGILVILSHTAKKLSFLGMVWPFLFILPGLYLAFMSDPDVWPMGNLSWIQAFEVNPEAAQHKIYSALLLALGILEFQRSRGKLGKVLALWSFPILAIFGAVLLFFHHHHGIAVEEMMHSMPGMHHDGHVMTAGMLKIQKEHFWFSMVGFGVITFKFLSDGNFWKRAVPPYLWCVCMAILGLLLIFYTE